MEKKKRGFNLRSFTSFSLVISTIIMSWSGFILYVAPPGRIANWGTWKLMLFTKTEWQALHTIFSYLFFILVIIHLFFVNWRTFLTYFKSKLMAGLNRKWELGGAIILSVVIFAGTLRNWTPFGPVMSFGEKVKGSWEGKFKAPPALHMETYTLDQISALLDSVPVSDLVTTLNVNNIKIASESGTLKEIAEYNHITPSDVYEILDAKYKKHSGPVQGEVPQGFGKLTIESAADRAGKETEEVIRILRSNDIEASPEMTLREVADKAGKTPRDIYGLFEK